MALVPQFTTDTVADPVTMNKLTDAVNANASAIERKIETSRYTIQDSDMRNGWGISATPYLRKIGNKVFCSLLSNSGSTTVGNIVFVAPPGYRPPTIFYSADLTYPDGTTTPTVQFFEIRVDGSVVIAQTQAKHFLSLEISWEV